MLKLPRYKQGYTLVETVLALAIGSAMMLSFSKSWPALWQQSQTLLRRYQLEQALQPLVKDLRRSGFCAGQCDLPGLQLGAFRGEAANSCVLISYDLNRNGIIETESEVFGYRLRAGNLESQRGVTQCDGSGWQRLLDQQAISVSLLQIEIEHSWRHPSLLRLQLQAHWLQQPNIRARIEQWLVLENR